MKCAIETFVVEPVAHDYRESIGMPPKDYEVIESAQQSASAERGELPEED